MSAASAVETFCHLHNVCLWSSEWQRKLDEERRSSNITLERESKSLEEKMIQVMFGLNML